MTDQHLPAEIGGRELAFDPRATSPMMTRGLEHLSVRYATVFKPRFIDSAYGESVWIGVEEDRRDRVLLLQVPLGGDKICQLPLPILDFGEQMIQVLNHLYVRRDFISLSGRLESVARETKQPLYAEFSTPVTYIFTREGTLEGAMVDKAIPEYSLRPGLLTELDIDDSEPGQIMSPIAVTDDGIWTWGFSWRNRPQQFTLRDRTFRPLRQSLEMGIYNGHNVGSPFFYLSNYLRACDASRIFVFSTDDLGLRLDIGSKDYGVEDSFVVDNPFTSTGSLLSAQEKLNLEEVYSIVWDQDVCLCSEIRASDDPLEVPMCVAISHYRREFSGLHQKSLFRLGSNELKFTPFTLITGYIVSYVWPRRNSPRRDECLAVHDLDGNLVRMIPLRLPRESSDIVVSPLRAE